MQGRMTQPRPRDQEDFRAAQRGARWSARLRTIPAALAAAVMGIPLSVYLSPVILGLVIVLIDLVNLVDGEPGALQALSWIGFLWLVPGVVALLATYVLIRWRLHRIGGDDLAASLGARPPNDQDAEERQLVDVVGELANAAGIEPPRVQVYDSPPANALV